ncbi:hypothetical protein J1N35_035275 [Gossypium stocksii]|uniref:Uncharacterized protein n=1 Tax=Gossypium stocksii TaxID=47602 RepID=A0A9D3UTM9_9ROSI|nr:hypothetical protein J1N35_035275 [Gossypium stocksii]
MYSRNLQEVPRAPRATQARVQLVQSSPKMLVPGVERTVCSLDTCPANLEFMENVSTKDRKCKGGDRQSANSRNYSSPVRVADVIMEVALTLARPRSWKDCLIGTSLRADREVKITERIEDVEYFDLLEKDIVRSSINGILTIYFSEQINQIVIRAIEHMVVIKLLGQNIGYVALQDKIFYVNLGRALISQVLINEGDSGFECSDDFAHRKNSADERLNSYKCLHGAIGGSLEGMVQHDSSRDSCP